MIVGIGHDLVEIERVARVWRRFGDRFTRRILTSGERNARAELSAQYLAGRFAAKEAAAKALGTGIRGEVTWQSLEIESDGRGAPYLRLSGGAAAEASRLGVVANHLSLTHTTEHASAVVVLEGEGSGSRPESSGGPGWTDRGQEE